MWWEYYCLIFNTSNKRVKAKVTVQSYKLIRGPVTFSISPLLIMLVGIYLSTCVPHSPLSASPFNRLSSAIVFIALWIVTRTQVLGNAVTVSTDEVSLRNAVTTSNALRVLWYFVLVCQVTAVFRLWRALAVFLSVPVTLISVDICLKGSTYYYVLTTFFIIVFIIIIGSSRPSSSSSKNIITVIIIVITIIIITTTTTNT